MSSTPLMQNMCANQPEDLGMFGSHSCQANYTPCTQLPAQQSISGGTFFVNPQTLPVPPVNYSASVSPQVIPMTYSSMIPVMDLSSISTSPMPPMINFVPTVPMLGYSLVPVACNGILSIPPASSSYSSESMQYLSPDMAFPPSTFSISRSCSPASDISAPEPPHVQEIARERALPSSSSSLSTGSNSTAGSNGAISKKELVQQCLNEIDNIFGDRVQSKGMRGPTVMRIKVKTRPALELIVDLLRTIEQNSKIVAVSCPKSTKKGKQHIRGFLAYIQAASVAEIAQVQRVFDAFNLPHQKLSLEVNPQKKN